MSWGVSLWDQFSELSTHAQRGIDFYEKFAHFAKERAAIENDYASKLRKLAKSYQPKKDEEQSLSWLVGFLAMLKEHNDLANQHDLIAEGLITKVHQPLNNSMKELKEARRKVMQEQSKQESIKQQSLDKLDKSKKQYEKAFKDGEKAVEYHNKLDNDKNYPRIDVEKAKDAMEVKIRQCDDCKGTYASDLQKANTTQREYYTTILPNLIQQLQTTEEQRINQTKQFIKIVAETDQAAIPIIQQCIKCIASASDIVDATKDTQTMINRLETGNAPQGDFPFEDFGVPGKGGPGPKQAYSSGTVKASKARPHVGIKNMEKDDFSHLPPAQQKKKLQEKIKDLSKDIAKESAQRDGLLKMKDVYTQNPKLGDASSVDKQLTEISGRIDKLQLELQKYSAYLAEAEGKAPPAMNVPQPSPTVTHTVPAASVTAKATPQLVSRDDSFDDEEQGGAVGSCRALYDYEGMDGAMSLVANEELTILEHDHGDGWTMVRNKMGVEGFAPTSYLEIH